ncbi:TPA: sugar transferase [Photobacterium damselae]|uniref:sugar transferase n=1 Tax=Photobacterium damselae TaxID=38293 RepID=UPI001F48B173|nr:sugar transferase [Photobacterium damselae]UKA10894.1 sugar transferase [Photobacterium damselae subsp. damselae]
MKRVFDFICSFLGLIILSPIVILIIVWIKCDSDGPVFFLQQRVGLNGKLFNIFKFRTMIPNAEKKGLKVTVGIDPRITKSGHFLRKTKLDELPQLLNVFLGQMSIVGPRPEVPEFMNEYSANIRSKILSVRPGITDLASIEFTNEAEILADSLEPKKKYIDDIMPIKARYYLDYVDNHNFINDIKIIFLTFKKII